VLTSVDDLFPSSQLPAARPIAPLRELGAYEALWLRERTSFRSLARLFGSRPGALPSDFVPEREAIAQCDRALQAAAASGTGAFGVTAQGMPEFPRRLRDAAFPVELLYHQGSLGLLSTRCVALVGTRHPSREGERCAIRLAQHFAGAGFTVFALQSSFRRPGLAWPARLAARGAICVRSIVDIEHHLGS